MQGIKFIIGIHKRLGTKGGKTVVQSVLIPVKYSINQVKQWLKEHNYLYSGLDESKNYWRARQYNPEDFMRLRTIGINPKRKTKTNPGAHYHAYQRLTGFRNASKSISGTDKHYWLGYSKAHSESYKLSKELNMNPPAKTYVGITHRAKPKLFTSYIKPTQSKYGKEFMQIYGPFKSYTDAEKFEDRLRKKHKMNPVLGKLSSKERNAFPVAYQHGAQQIKEGLSWVKIIFKTIKAANEFSTWLARHNFAYKQPYQNKLGQLVVSFQEHTQYSK